ncbi:MAG: bifunctional oligoribonuclease/PAP phosphatase NrnA [Erysipelotrichaceae bacterium]|nr:bifunctional oligoribonuclease/PAP phosphatase NrnA [Erysipelotrichaceae bacterium]
MYKDILDKILEFDQISIFRHQKPDGDAMFSSLALNQFIIDNFPSKKVKICGSDEYEIISRNDNASDRFIRDSLAIILDTSTKERIDDQRALKAKYTIKIDHHPFGEDYADLNHVKVKSAAAAEFLAEILYSKDFKEFKVSPQTCKYLYCGIATDTLNFKTANTTADSFKIAAKLITKGDIKVSDCYEYLFTDDISVFQKVSKIRNELKLRDKFGYIILDQKKLNELDMDPSEAKNHITELGTIRNINVWAFAVENNERLFDVSVRSKRNYTINSFCRDYGGGGHTNAAGVKDMTKEQLNALFDSLANVSK